MSYRLDEPLKLVHDGICGSIKPATPDSKTLFLLLVDDKCRFMWLVLLQAKSEAAEVIKRIQARAEAKCGKKMQVLRMDRAREFSSDDRGSVRRRPHNHWMWHGSSWEIQEGHVKELQDERSRRAQLQARHQSAIEYCRHHHLSRCVRKEATGHS